MHCLSNTTGPVGYGETPGETRNFAASPTGKMNVKELITRANTVPIFHIFKHYGMRFDPYTHKATCPFKGHKGGHENTPSFKLYEETNSYHCFGCEVGYSVVDFVVEMDRCSPEKAATKILALFASEVDEDLLVECTNYSERLEIMMKFSNSVLEFRQNYDSLHATKFIEYICWIYDRLNLRHKLNNEALRRTVELCIEHIELYSSQIILSLEERYLKQICQ